VPYVPLDVDLKIAEELYSLLIEEGRSEQATDVDGKRHYLEAVRTTLNLMHLAQEYELIQPQLALKLYQMAYAVRPQTVHTQSAYQRYQHIQTSEEHLILLMTQEKSNGDDLYKNSRYAEALKHYEDGHDLAIKTRRKDDQAYFVSQIGICLGKLGKYEKASAYINEYRELCKEMIFPRGIAVAEANLGWVLDLQGKHDEAVSHYEKALEIRIQLGDEEEVAKLRQWIGKV
jgi:tetratricopeptide (TPR) repeat protein